MDESQFYSDIIYLDLQSYVVQLPFASPASPPPCIPSFPQYLVI